MSLLILAVGSDDELCQAFVELDSRRASGANRWEHGHLHSATERIRL